MDSELPVLPELPGLSARTAASLAALDGLPVADHARVYAHVHSDLLDALADTDGQGAEAPA